MQFSLKIMEIKQINNVTLPVEVHIPVLCLTVTEQHEGILLLFLSSCEGKKKQAKRFMPMLTCLHTMWSFLNWNRHWALRDIRHTTQYPWLFFFSSVYLWSNFHSKNVWKEILSVMMSILWFLHSHEFSEALWKMYLKMLKIIPRVL